MQIDRHIFTGGLNSDDNNLNFPATDFVELVNARNYSDGNDGSIVEVPAPVAVSQSLPSGENKFIGGVDDVSGSYFFVWNSLGNHSVFRYLNESVTLLYQNPSLKFSRDMWITGAVFGDILYFTDGTNEPKKINITRALAGEYTADIDEVLMIKRGPLRPLVTSKYNDPNIEIDIIGDNTYTFAYRYVYKDGEVSVLSPFSQAIPPNDPAAQLALSPLNAISISVPQDEVVPSTVDKIEFLFKDMARTTWYTFSSGTATTVNYNGQGGVAISDIDSTRMFDYVPPVAKTMSGMKNRIFMGNITEHAAEAATPIATISASEIDIDTEFSSSIGTWVLFADSFDVYRDEYNIQFDDFRPVQWYTVDLKEWVVLVDGLYHYPDPTRNDLDYAQLPGATYISPSALTSAQIISNLAARLAARETTELATLTQQYPQYSLTTVPNNNQTTTVKDSVTVLGFGSGSLPTGAVLSCYAPGATYQFGVAYYDRQGRLGRVVTKDAWKLSTPRRTFKQTPSTDDKAIRSIAVSVNGPTTTVPTWADYYNVVRTKNQTYSYIVQGISNGNKYAYYNSSNELTYTDTFDANTRFLALRVTWLNNNDRGIDAAEGDQLHVIFKNSTLNYATQEALLGATGVYDGEYVLFSAADLGSLLNQTIWFTYVRPFKRESTDLFYEVSAPLAIVNPGTTSRRHQIGVPINLPGDCYLQQVGLTILTGNTAGGLDVVAIQTAVGNGSTYLDTVGRPMLPLTKNNPNRNTTIVFGQQYFPNGTINMLSTFYAFDQRDLDGDSGAIVSIVNTDKSEGAGSVLLALCEKKTYSIYIGEAQLSYSNASAGLAITDGVIGSINELAGGVGCQNPESVCVNPGQVFWVDLGNLAVVQYTRAGLQDLVQRKMIRHFVKLLTALSKAKSRIYLGFNTARQELTLTHEQSAGSNFSGSDALSVLYTEQDSFTETREIADNGTVDPGEPGDSNLGEPGDSNLSVDFGFSGGTVTDASAGRTDETTTG